MFRAASGDFRTTALSAGELGRPTGARLSTAISQGLTKPIYPVIFLGPLAASDPAPWRGIAAELCCDYRQIAIGDLKCGRHREGDRALIDPIRRVIDFTDRPRSGR